MDVRVGLWRRLSAEELMLLNCGVGEDSWESLGLQGHATSPFSRRSALGFLWKECCWSWNYSSTLATSCKELTHWKRLWYWEGLGAGGEGDDRGWDGWMASLTGWTWVWVNSGNWWWTGRPGMLWFMGSQRVRHDWATELNWLNWYQKSLYLKKAVMLMVVDANIPKFWFLLKTQILSLATKAVCCVPWSDRFVSFVIKKTLRKHLSLNNHSMSVSRSFK